MSIIAQMILDSVSKDTGKRLSTLLLRYPRFIHAEFMTHRVFSRNASSSRAIPVEKMIDLIREDTAMPVHWGLNQPGMQSKPENTPVREITCDGGYGMPESTSTWDCKEEWIKSRDEAIDRALAFHKAGYHKQIVNRLLEPFMHITVLVTATEWDNFFLLRNHPDAQPEIRELAFKMKLAMACSTPTLRERDEWHLPFVIPEDCMPDLKTAIHCSVARCARTSYLNHDRSVPSIEKDLKLYDRLVGSIPMHASPTEHQARPAEDAELPFANFRGWVQFRGILEQVTPQN